MITRPRPPAAPQVDCCPPGCGATVWCSDVEPRCGAAQRCSARSQEAVMWGREYYCASIMYIKSAAVVKTIRIKNRKVVTVPKNNSLSSRSKVIMIKIMN